MAKNPAKKQPTSSVNTELQVQRVQRVDTVYSLLLSGVRRCEVLEFVATEHPEWGIGVRQVDSLIAQAKKRLREASDARRDEELGLALARLELLHGKSFKDGDYRGCAAIVKQRTDLLGLAAPTRVDFSGDTRTEVVVRYADD